MTKTLSESAVIKVDGKYRECKAVLVRSTGGKQVVYFDNDGCELHREPLSRSQFKDSDKQDSQDNTERDVWRTAYDEALFAAFEDIISAAEGEARAAAYTTARKQAKDHADAAVSAYRSKGV